ncbi:MAG: hypothetical protein ACRDTG_17310 [Pseudonocardiaceae bacterium]
MSGPGGGQSGPLPGMPGAQTASAPAPVRDSYEPPGYPQPITTTGGGGFSVDVERAPQAIADLRKAADALRDEAEKSRNLAYMKPPGLDRVSHNAVQVFVDAAVGPDGSLRMALECAARRLDDDANKLEASLKSHLGADNYSIPQARELKFEERQ